MLFFFVRFLFVCCKNCHVFKSFFFIEVVSGRQFYLIFFLFQLCYCHFTPLHVSCFLSFFPRSVVHTHTQEQNKKNYWFCAQSPFRD